MNELQKLMKLIDMIEKGKGLALSSVLEETQKVKDENSKIIENIDEIVGYIKALNEKVDSIPLNEEIGKLADRLNKELSKLAENTEKTQNDKMSRAEKALLGKIDKLAKELRDEMSQITPDVYFEETKELIEKEIDPKDLAPKLEPEIDITKLKNFSDIEKRIKEASDIRDEVKSNLSRMTAGGGSNVTIKHNGALVGSGTAINFTGSGVASISHNGNTATVNISGGSSASTFLDLTDTPSSYSGQALKFARVNAGETALEFATPSGSGNVSTTTIADNALVRGDGGTTDIQGSGITIDDSDNISGVGTLNSHTIPGGTGTLALTSDLSTYLENVVEDTTPQLGGNLDTNGNSIVSVGANDVAIAPAAGRSAIIQTAPLEVKNTSTIVHRLLHNGASYLGNGAGGQLRVGFGGVTSATAKIHIGAGTTSASTAPIKLTAGTNMTTPEAGAIEYDGTDLFFTDGTATRRTILNNSDIGSSVQAYDADLAGIASLTINANDLIVGDGANSFTTTTITTFGKSLIDDANASTARSTLGLAIGTDVQAQDAFLQNIADLVDPNADRLLFWDDSAGVVTWLTAGSGLTISGTTISASGSGVSFGADNQIPFTNATTDDFDYSANLTYDGTDLIVGGVDVLTETNTKTTTNKTLGTGTVFSASPTINSGVKFSFVANTTAGLNVGAIGGAPSSLVDGDIWYNSDTNVFQGRLGSASRTFLMTSNKISDLASTTSAELASTISDETGSGALVFGTNPSIAGAVLTGVIDGGGATSFEIPNGAGGTTVDAAGEVTVDTTSGTLNYHDGTAERVLTPIQSKSITIESPTGSEDISMFYTDEAITITKIVAVLVGSATPSVTWTLRHGTDRSGTGAEAVTSGTTTTSTTTGSVVTSFNDATVVADSFLWCETTAQSGTVGQLNITVFYRQDA